MATSGIRHGGRVLSPCIRSRGRPHPSALCTALTTSRMARLDWAASTWSLMRDACVLPGGVRGAGDVAVGAAGREPSEVVLLRGPARQRAGAGAEDDQRLVAEAGQLGGP